MGVEGGPAAGCTEPGLPEVGLKSGILKVLGDSCGCERGTMLAIEALANGAAIFFFLNMFYRGQVQKIGAKITNESFKLAGSELRGPWT